MNSTALRLIEQPAAELPLALELPEALPFDEWVSIGRRLCHGQQAINWHIGDWWAFGDFRYGERATVAAAGIFGKEFGTLRNLAVVARAFDVSRRRDVLSFTHHVEAASLPAKEADAILDRAVRDRLSTRDLRREVQAMRAVANDRVASAPKPAIVEPEPEPAQVPKNELTEAYARYLEAMECLEEYRPLTKRELDFLTVAKDALGDAYAERRACPEDFDVVMVEQGRLACETWFGASRITVNRWLIQRGKKRLLDDRAAYVRHQRNMAKSHAPLHADDPVSEIDMLLPIARQAAHHLRISRFGGYKVSQCEQGGWFVGTVRKTSEELIVMAERVGFDRAAAAAEAEREGY